MTSTVLDINQDMKQRKVVIASRPENLSIIENFIEQIQVEFGIKDDVYGNIVIALTEAVNNAINHGNKRDDSKNVVVVAVLKGPFLLEISVEDEGDGFNYLDVPDPTLPENVLSESGRGIYIMKEITDNFSYNEKGNALVMQFNI